MDRSSDWQSLMLFAVLVFLAIFSSVRLFVLREGLRTPATAIGILFPVVFVGIILGYLFKYARHPNRSLLYKTAARATFALTVLSTTTGVLIVLGQQTQGVQIATPTVLVTETGLGGGLVGLVVGHLSGLLFIQRRETRTREQRLQVLTRVLRHNLRNDLNIALAYIEAAANDSAQPTPNDLTKAETAIYHLIETANLARDAQSSLESDTTYEQDLVDHAETVVAHAREEFPYTTIRFGTTVPELPAAALDGLTDALQGIIRNALRPGSGPIEVRVYRSGSMGIIEIVDEDGGLHQQELSVIETGEETALDHGSGLGLWVAYWIVEGSDGEFSFEANGTTSVRLALPAVDPSTTADGVPVPAR